MYICFFFSNRYCHITDDIQNFYRSHFYCSLKLLTDSRKNCHKIDADLLQKNQIKPDWTISIYSYNNFQSLVLSKNSSIAGSWIKNSIKEIFWFSSESTILKKSTTRLNIIFLSNLNLSDRALRSSTHSMISISPSL